MSTHPLNSPHTFWVMRRTKGGALPAPSSSSSSSSSEGIITAASSSSSASGGDKSKDEYERSIQQIGTFATIEEFWGMFGFIVRPSEAFIASTIATDIHMFRSGVKPLWEDPANRRGGKWIVRLKKGWVARYWEALILAVIGEQFNEYGSEITGVVISVRHHDYVLSLWTRNADNSDAVMKIRDLMKKNLKLPAFVPLEYKRHDTAVAEASTSASSSSSAVTGPSRGGSTTRSGGMREGGNTTFTSAGSLPTSSTAPSSSGTSTQGTSSSSTNSAPAWRERNPLITSSTAGGAGEPGGAWR